MKTRQKAILVRALFIALALVMALSACTSSVSPSGSPSSSAPGNSGTPDSSGPTGSAFDIDAAEIIRPVVLAEAEGTDFPVEDVLTPIWHEKTKVIPEFVTAPDGQELIQYFQMQSVADTMPHVIAVPNAVVDSPTVMTYLKSQNLLREITLDDIYKYMPRTLERAEKEWGSITIEDWVTANLDIEDRRLYYFPQFPMNAVLDLDFSEVYNDPVSYYQSYRPYNWFFRDDILKMIFPDAMSESELRQLIVDKGGRITYEDINDVPIKNMEDLYAYLKKVKELGLTVNGTPVTPAQLQSTSAPDSVWWSTVSLYDQHWQGEFIYSYDSYDYFCNDPDWKEYLRWFNRFFNEGLIGQETFIQKDDQRDAKVVNGEYAIFQEWLPVTNARKLAADENRGYGYRKIPLFIEPTSLINEYQDFSEKVFSLKNDWGSAAITTALPEEQWAQILNWIDWNQSLEADELRAWGPPEFSTGEGMNRRFKPEYADLEKWVLYSDHKGSTGGKDGIYYGMKFENLHNGLLSGGGYFYSPSSVYPPDLSDPANIDVDYYNDYAVRKYYYDMMTKYVELTATPELLELKLAYESALETFNNEIRPDLGYQNSDAQTAVVKAIVGKVEDFDKNYGEFESKFLNETFQNELAKLRNLFLPMKALEKELRKPLD